MSNIRGTCHTGGLQFDGTILTNYHVVADKNADRNGTDSSADAPRETAYQICLTTAVERASSCAYVADLVAFDKKNDIALLRIAPPEGVGSALFPHLELEQNNVVNISDSVTALGYPNIGG